MYYPHNFTQRFVGDEVEQQSRRVHVKTKFELARHSTKHFFGSHRWRLVWVLSMAWDVTDGRVFRVVISKNRHAITELVINDNKHINRVVLP